MASDADIEQLTSITQCSPDIARRALDKYRDVGSAVTAFFDEGGRFNSLEEETKNQHRSWMDFNDDSAKQVLPNQTPQGGTRPSSSANANPTDYSMLGNDASNPIDLSGGSSEDDELQKALQASLQSHEDHTRQQQQQHEPAGNMNEEDAMDRAIAESLDLTSKGNTEEPQIIDLPDERRGENFPMALLTHVASLMPIAYTLQAILASPAVTRALLQFRPVDHRIWLGMQDYYKGVSPSKSPLRGSNSYRGLEMSVRPSFDMTWRLQLLAAFCKDSARARCNVGDLVANVPLEILRLNSKGDWPGAVVSGYYGRLVEAFYHASRFVHDTKWEPSSSDEPKGLPWEELKATFHYTIATPNYSTTTSPPEQGSHSILIRPNDVACTITSALQASLDTQRARFVQMPQLLAIEVRPQEQRLAPGQSYVPLQLEPVIYLDRFLASRSQDVDAAHKSESGQVQKLQNLIAAIERRRQSITTQNGTPVVETLKQSIEYFDQLCKPGDDPIRAESQAEAASQLKKILVAIESEGADLDQRLASERSNLATLQKENQERQRVAFDGADWKTAKYTLRAVFMTDFDQQWLYFKTSKGWWYNRGGNVQKISEEEVLNDRSGTNSLLGPSFVLYDRSESEDMDESISGLQVPEAIETQIEQDNDLLESTLFSLGSPDVASGNSDGNTAGGDVTMKEDSA